MQRRIAIDINDLTIGYTNRKDVYPVAESINASMLCGEVIALIGRNGSGKSTLLRTISGYQKPLSGALSYMDEPLNELNAKKLSKLIAVVLTEIPISTNLTVRELVSLGRTPYTDFFGSIRGADRKIVDWAMEAVGVNGLSDRKIATLSDGERQKCMIAKALAQETPIIALDEPTAFLDYPSKVALFRLLQSLARKMNKAILLSTHDIELAFRLCDALWLMSEKTLHCGTSSELVKNGVLKTFMESDVVGFNEEKKEFEIIQSK